MILDVLGRVNMTRDPAMSERAMRLGRVGLKSVRNQLLFQRSADCNCRILAARACRMAQLGWSRRAVQMSGEQRIAASRERVWGALNDPIILKQCVPGCETLEKLSETSYQATVAIKIGPIGARFAGQMELTDLDQPAACTISGQGQGGAAGFAKGGAKVRLEEDAGTTILRYDVDAQVGGRLAQVGGALIDATAKRLANQFFKKFGTLVAASAEQADAAASPAEMPTAPAEMPVLAVAASRPESGVASAPDRSGGAVVVPVPAKAAPVVWLLAVTLAGLGGIALGGGGHGAASLFDWATLAVAMLAIAVAATASPFGRTTNIILDDAAITRIAARSRDDGR